MNEKANLAASGDFVSLPRDDEYKLYFEQMTRVFDTLDKWCHLQSTGGNEEAKVLRLFLKRMLSSIELLRERQRFRPDKNLKLDLNESGFPHYIGLEELSADFRLMDERDKHIPTMTELKERALNTLFETKEEPLAELALMAERRYHELLRKADFMGPFRFAGIVPMGEKGKRRHYLCAWSCYSIKDNLPYVYSMLFEQDTRAQALEKKGDAYRDLKDAISQEGNRVPPLAVVAAALDDRLDAIHPKILKRTRIGPLALPRFTFDQGHLAIMVKGLARPSEFSVEVRTETVFASQEIIKEKGGWLRPDKIRSIFAIPETDLECFEAKVSRIHKYIIMPHHLLQHMRDSDPELAQLYADYVKIVFDDQQKVYEL